MKALKEKRNSLRSLWRMGLVILSVFAIAFAACNKGGGGGTIIDPPDPTPTAGPPPPVSPAATDPYVISFTIVTQPNQPSYEGQPAKFGGMVVDVIYSNGKVVAKAPLSEFYTSPRIMGFTEITPEWTAASTPRRLPLYHKSNPTWHAWVELPAVVPLHRSGANAFYAGSADKGAPPLGYDADNGLKSSGTLTKQAYFQDDYAPDFAGVTVLAAYPPYLIRSDNAGADVVYDDDDNAVWSTSPAPGKKTINTLRANSGIALDLVTNREWYTFPDKEYDHPEGGRHHYFHGGIDPLARNSDRAGTINALISRGNGTATYPNKTLEFDFDDFYFVRYVEVNKPVKWGKYFEDDPDYPSAYSTASAYWIAELVKGDVELLVHYDGTPETKIRSAVEFYRAAYLGFASVTAPDFSLLSNDPELVTCKLKYYSFYDTFYGTSIAGLWNLPNEAVSVVVPVAEFQDEVVIQRRDLTANPRPFQLLGRPGRAITDNVTAGGPFTYTSNYAMSDEELLAFNKTFKLVGVYSLNGETVYGGGFSVGAATWFGTAGTGMPGDFVNPADGEVELRGIEIKIPNSYRTGTGDWFKRYAGIVAEVSEDDFQVLPFHLWKK